MGVVLGLSDKQLARVRSRLEVFAGEMFEPMGRSDRRRWGEVYVRGLMLDGRRKSIEPMAARLEDGDEQCLQQFVNQSPWRSEPVRERLAVRMSAVIEPEAWVIDDTGFPKFGRQSVGVARQYSGALGKIGNSRANALGHSRPDRDRLARRPIPVARIRIPDDRPWRRTRRHLRAGARSADRPRHVQLSPVAAVANQPPPAAAHARSRGQTLVHRTQRPTIRASDARIDRVRGDPRPAHRPAAATRSQRTVPCRRAHPRRALPRHPA